MKLVKKETYPLMYKGWVVKKNSKGYLGAHNLSTGSVIVPLYSKWVKLKLLIDNMK